MARIDKYQPESGGFRALLGFTPVTGDLSKIIPVEIDSNGVAIKCVAAKCTGVVCMDELLALGDAVDIMTDGEIVDVTPALVSGTDYYAAAAGTYGTTSTSATFIGEAIETWRMVVRVGRSR